MQVFFKPLTVSFFLSNKMNTVTVDLPPGFHFQKVLDVKDGLLECLAVDDKNNQYKTLVIIFNLE